MACVDLSEYSLMTIEHALSVVQGSQAKVVLLNVINNRDVDAMRIAAPYLPGNVAVESYIERVKNERQQKIKEMVEENFAGEKSKMTILIRVGLPFEAILKTIEEEKIELVVLGNKGKSNLIGTLHGSNGERVFRHSPVPVLSVRNRDKFTRKR